MDGNGAAGKRAGIVTQLSQFRHNDVTGRGQLAPVAAIRLSSGGVAKKLETTS
jgi:hypothetical protein